MVRIKFNRGQPLQVNSELHIVDKDGQDAPLDIEAKELGSGSSGAVYRAVQDGILPRAVKILAPSDDLLAKFTMDDLTRGFEDERFKLSQLTHSHIAKLISFGFFTIPGDNTVKVPYLVMEYIDGVKLHEYLRTGLRNEYTDNREKVVGVILAMLRDVLAALQYMHARNAVHADVKEANVIVRPADRPEAILVDLGCAHIFSDSPGDEPTYFNSSRSRNNAKWKALVNQQVARAEIWRERVRIDLYQFGVMLRVLLKVYDWTHETAYAWQDETRETLLWAIGRLGAVTLERVAEKCIQEKYTSAADVSDDLAAIAPDFASPLGVPELAMGTYASTSISLPEARVPLTLRFRAIVNHPLVQRLHCVSQLDFIRLVFAGASHTRFLHSLEAYNLTRQYIAALSGDSVFLAYAGDKCSIQAGLVAGLAHDIGHYPLEHVFEDFAAKREIDGSYADVLSDDGVARALMSVGPEKARTTLRDAADAMCHDSSGRLRRAIPSFPQLIAEVCGDRTLERLRDVLCPSGDDPGARILHTIIDGPIDVDKVAYLRTDALMTGAQYGRGVDLDPLLGSLTCWSGGTIAGSPVGPSVAVRTKAICAVEAIATGRRWMFQRVYWNHSNRAMMAMLRFPIQCLMDDGLLTFDDYFVGTYRKTDVEAVKWVDELFCKVMGRKDLDIENPALCLVEGRRVLYKRLLEIGSGESAQRDAARAYLLSRPCREWLKTAHDIAEIIRTEIPEARDSDVLLDVPVCDRPSLQDLPVRTAPGWTTMAVLSDEYRQTKAFFTAGSMYCRVYVHPELRRLIGEKGARTGLEEAILKTLAGF